MKIAKSKPKGLMMRKKKVKVDRLNDAEEESQSRKAYGCRRRNSKSRGLMMQKPEGSTRRKQNVKFERLNNAKAKRQCRKVSP